MRKLVKAAIAVGACLVLTGCPKATSVTGSVTGAGAVLGIKVGESLSPALSYHVAQGASITVGYDNGKSCTFRGPIDFFPGADGSVCEKDEKKKKDDDDKNQDKDQNQQEQASNGVDDATSGINAPEVTPSSVPDYSGINAPEVTPTPVPQFSGGGGGVGGPQVVATSVPTFTRIMEVVNNPILTTTLSIIGAASVVKEVHDRTDGSNGDKPISK